MIYQLKVTLKHLSSPVWRRLEIDSRISFQELHNLIQIAFEWENCHLHSFSVRKSNGVNIANQDVEIGSLDEADLFGIVLETITYEEKDEIVGDWLLKEKDKCLYTYDYGEDWEHDIILEKIIQPTENVFYPRCVKAKGISPGEEGVSFYNELVEIDMHELCEEINEAFQAYITSSSLIGEATDEQWKELFSVANAFKQLKPWTWLDDSQIFAIKHPTHNELIYCSILGASHQEFGLAAYIGQQGLQSLQQTMTGVSFEELIYNQRSLLVSFSNREELEKEDYQLIKALDLKYRGKKQWPMFRSFSPGYFPWLLNKEEVELLTYLLPLVIKVCKQVQQQPGIIPNYLGQSVSLFHSEGDVELVKTPIVAKQTALISHYSLDELELLRIRKEYPKVMIPIELDYFYLDDPIQETSDTRPFFPIMFLSVETHNQLIVYQDVIHPSELTDIPSNIIHMFYHLQAIPNEILIQRDELYAMLQPITQKLGIKLTLLQQLKIMPKVKKELLSFL